MDNTNCPASVARHSHPAHLSILQTPFVTLDWSLNFGRPSSRDDDDNNDHVDCDADNDYADGDLILL